MRKIKEENLDGRMREERETCFPSATQNEQRKGAGMR